MRVLSSFRALAAFVLVALASAPAWAQQQTGSLVLEIADASGNPIAGAEVIIESDKTPTALRNADERGRARFLLLPPGTYIVDIRAEGYTAIRREIAVPLGGTVIEPITLAQGELTETVEVIAAPEVDVTKTSTGEVYTTEEIQNVQLGSANRSYLSVLGKAAGVVGGGGNPSVHGATIGENVYLIDGVNTTDPVTGTFGLLTNFDAIEQVELTTGGFQAEYGWATGGYVNQITKSGTNELAGTVDLRYYDQGFIENTEYFPGGEDEEFRQLSFTLGGPIVKDKAWFFLGLEDNVTRIATTGANAVREFEGASYIGKLTFQPAANHRIAFQYSADPAEISNDNASAFVAKEAGDFQEQGANFYKLTYWGGLTDEWALQLNLGKYESELNTFPLDDSGLPSVTDVFTGYLFQNYNDAQFTERFNDQAALSLERAWSGSKGDHDLKFGIDFQRTKLEASQYAPGGERWTSIGCDDDPTCLDADGNGDTIPDNIYEIERVNSVGTVPNPGDNMALFVQDTWRRGKMTLDYGLRWERAQAERDDGKTVVDGDLIQPRLGMAWDIKGDRSQKVYWSLTRRMHPGILAVPSIVNGRNNTSDYFYNEVYIDFDCDGDGAIEFEFTYCGSLGGPSSSRVEDGLKPTYLDEFIVGWQRSLKKRHSLGARLVLNETKDIIEDTIDDPSLGTYVVKNLEGLERRYEGIELEYSWRHARGGLTANWTIARARGNVEYTQGIGSDFDYPGIHDVNRWGYLSNDRRHRIKVFGWVNLPKGFSVHYDFFHGSGAPYNRAELLSGFDPDTGLPLYGFRYLDKRGSHRLPSTTNLDAEVRKKWSFGKADDKHLVLIGSIANVLGANSPTLVSEIDGPAWGTPIARQAPRSYELGLRFEF